MMITKTFLLLTLLAYSIIVSQSFMYILALKQVQLNLNGNSYIELRKLIDVSMNNTLRYVVYFALLFNLALVISTYSNPGSLLFITTVIAFAALVLDVLIAIKGNIPINTVISSWSSDAYPANWAEYRAKWLHLFQYRQIANITGFVSLIIGTVWVEIKPLQAIYTGITQKW